MANRNTRIRGIQILDKGVDTAQIADSAIEALQINADAVTTIKILDDNVTNDKLANIAQGSIKVGGGSNAPTDLNAKTDTYMLIGDGTDITSVEVTGDITIGNTGVTAIGATKVIDTMINDDVASGLAGVGLSATTGVMAVDLQEVAEVAIAVADDYIAILDGGISGDTKKEKFADVMTAVAGTGLTATNGVLSVDEHAQGIITEDDIVRNEVVEPDTASDTDYTLANTPVVGTVNIYWNGMLQQPGTGEDYIIDGASIVFSDAIDASDLVIADYIIT